MDERNERSQAKHYCFTDYTFDSPMAYLQDIATNWDSASYVVFQGEICPETGRQHLQGYAEFSKKLRLSGLKKLSPSAHWSARRGTREEARDYCMEEVKKGVPRWADPLEFGEWVTVAQGRRSDLEVVVEYGKLHPSFRAIATEYPIQAIRYGRGLREWLGTLLPVTRLQPPRVVLLFGPPGCGKSFQSRRLADGLPLWLSSIGAGNFPFQGYNGESSALLEEFEGAASHLTLNDFLRLVDRYDGFQVGVKGGSVYWVPSLILFTSNVHPSKWWDYTTRTSRQWAVSRRFTDVYWYRREATPEAPFFEPLHLTPGATVRDGDRDLSWAHFWAGPSAPVRRELGPLDNYVVQDIAGEYVW